MKLSNQRILNDSTKLGDISQKELPVKVSYAIAKNLGKLEVELKTYNIEREKLLEKYSIKDDQGKTIADENNQIKLQPDCIVNWNSDIKELLAIENEVDIHKFNIIALEGFNMTPADLMVIDYMIEE